MTEEQEQTTNEFRELIATLEAQYNETMLSLEPKTGAEEVTETEEPEGYNCKIIEAIDKITLNALTTEGNIKPETRANLLALNVIRNSRVG